MCPCVLVVIADMLEEDVYEDASKKTMSFLRSEEGPTAAEYAVMLALIVVLCFVAVTSIGNKAKATYSTLEGGLPDGSE